MKISLFRPAFCRTRTNTNPNGTEANAAGRSVRACVEQTKQVRNDSGGRGALAKFLEKFAKIEEFVGVAHSPAFCMSDFL
jgi:DNA-binding transcriptional regulator/RsmH inhibitor MraZ